MRRRTAIAPNVALGRTVTVVDSTACRSCARMGTRGSPGLRLRITVSRSAPTRDWYAHMALVDLRIVSVNVKLLVSSSTTANLADSMTLSVLAATEISNEAPCTNGVVGNRSTKLSVKYSSSYTCGSTTLLSGARPARDCPYESVICPLSSQSAVTCTVTMHCPQIACGTHDPDRAFAPACAATT